jgi:hypothetical protein
MAGFRPSLFLMPERTAGDALDPDEAALAVIAAFIGDCLADPDVIEVLILDEVQRAASSIDSR